MPQEEQDILLFLESGSMSSAVNTHYKLQLNNEKNKKNLFFLTNINK